ncbi:MAG: hypothetical protein R3B96_05190 [Pirellulaceae bacterium]
MVRPFRGQYGEVAQEHGRDLYTNNEPVINYEDVDTESDPARPRLYGLVGAEVIEKVWRETSHETRTKSQGGRDRFLGCCYKVRCCGAKSISVIGQATAHRRGSSSPFAAQDIRYSNYATQGSIRVSWSHHSGTPISRDSPCPRNPER